MHLVILQNLMPHQITEWIAWFMESVFQLILSVICISIISFIIRNFAS